MTKVTPEKKNLGESGTPEDYLPGENSPRRKTTGKLLPGGLLTLTGVGASVKFWHELRSVHVEQVAIILIIHFSSFFLSSSFQLFTFLPEG